MVRRPIVAIHAIHCSYLMLGGIVLEVCRAVLRHRAMRSGEPDPRDDLPLLVGRNVFNLVAQIHVPMNSTDRPMIRITSANLQRQADGKWRVRFVRKEMRVSAVEVARISAWPMTLFAGFLSWPKILHGRLDRPLNVIGERAVKLMHAVQFRFHKGFRSRTDMALHAADARVRRVQVSNEFWLHRRVTGLAAELH